MSLHLLTYGDRCYRGPRRQVCAEARKTGWFASVEGHSPRTLDRNFKQRFRDILAMPRGGGYWIWKPHIVHRKLQQVAADDIVIYADAGCTIDPSGQRRLRDYERMVADHDSGWLAFALRKPEEHYTNEKLFEYFGIGAGDDAMRKSPQLMAGIQILRKCDTTLAMLKQALVLLGEDPHLFTDKYNEYRRTTCFVDHRHDQSVLSLLAKRAGVAVLPDETWTPNWEEMQGVPFLATRRRQVRRQSTVAAIAQHWLGRAA